MDLENIVSKGIENAIKEIVDDTIEDLMYQRDDVINKVIREHAEKMLKEDQDLIVMLKNRIKDLIDRQ